MSPHQIVRTAGQVLLTMLLLSICSTLLEKQRRMYSIRLSVELRTQPSLVPCSTGRIPYSNCVSQFRFEPRCRPSYSTS
ncbi:hypothetical protein V1521DRAFT_439332 [Lipomyces starkeyi]